MNFIRYDVCTDCFFFVAYGEELEDCPDGKGQEIADAMDREIGDSSGHFACGAPPAEECEEGQDEYIEFSYRGCELCWSQLGGSLHAITLCIPDKDTD